MCAEPGRLRLAIRGVVQGVGFRPYFYDLALRHGLSGWVANTADGVLAEVQGPSNQLAAFVEALPRHAPPLAFIVACEAAPRLPSASEKGMRIEPSLGAERRSALLPPDVTVCDDCLRELQDPHDRRFRYPFINCTNCGPRYTIIDDIPYDRDKTTMARFKMCPACQAEYDDPKDRRFHAQPNACWSCGPKLWAATPDGRQLSCEDALASAAQWLKDGQILAIKGLGGFHLAVDATQGAAVARLRARKHREGKPLAVMCRDLAEAARHVQLDATARDLLTSRHRPIVLLPRVPASPIAPQVAPGNPNLGVMLPYTPIHCLLLQQAPASLVMTSGNLTEEPICIGNDEALERLGSIADAFLLHDRDILVRNDDSVMRVIAGVPRFLRRSRGYVPLPVLLRHELPPALGVGAELKNTVCLTRGAMAFLSQHVGDQANLAAYDAMVDTIARLQRIVDVAPVRIGADMHDDYASSRWAMAQSVPVVRVQHHHAHIAACLAEHQRCDRVLGVVLEGTGLGTDGTVWGGELLIADLARFERVGHLRPVRLPGGDRAAQQPWRMAISYLVHALGDAWWGYLPPSLGTIDEMRLRAVAQLAQTGAASPWTSSCGRLFDGVAALCGLVMEARFEAEAAMALEQHALRVWERDTEAFDVVPHESEGLLLIEPSDFVRAVLDALAAGVPVDVVASRFHRGLALALARACALLGERTGLGVVALSGGVFQNRVLTEVLVNLLTQGGFEVLTHRLVPTNDAGIALGQAVVAAGAGVTTRQESSRPPCSSDMPISS
ncbi:MAG: carbamoyltransferase HypF [Polyangiaceae bacterium]|nr:carbamoyltransferase HypF [Polyangiaceae bacterium]